MIRLPPTPAVQPDPVLDKFASSPRVNLHFLFYWPGLLGSDLFLLRLTKQYISFLARHFLLNILNPALFTSMLSCWQSSSLLRWKPEVGQGVVVHVGQDQLVKTLLHMVPLMYLVFCKHLKLPCC